MLKMGFPTKWIMECISSTTILVLANGSPTAEFVLGRGLRQGDPLSPFLFILAVEGLSVMVSNVVARHMYNGYRVGGGAFKVTHLQYVDDTLFVGMASWKNVWAIKSILQLFEVTSGLKANFFKSQLMGFNVNKSWLRVAKRVLNCRSGGTPFKYLGLPIGANHRKKSTWDPVVEKVRKRLSLWNNKNMSLCGRIVLLKSIFIALSIFFLSFFLAPKGIISSLESLFKQFLWGGGKRM